MTSASARSAIPNTADCCQVRAMLCTGPLCRQRDAIARSAGQTMTVLRRQMTEIRRTLSGRRRRLQGADGGEEASVMTRRSWALFAAMCLIWGIPYLLIRVAVRDVQPGTLVFARTAIGGLLLLPFALAKGGLVDVARRWRWLLLFTVIEIAVPWLLLSDAERVLSSSLSGLLVAVVPLVGVVVARIDR